METYRLRPKALEDLEAIGDYIAADNPARAVSFINEIEEVFARVARQPRAYRRRNDLAKGLRQAIHGRYLILFSETSESVVIERVVHGARRLEDLL